MRRFPLILAWLILLLGAVFILIAVTARAEIRRLVIDDFSGGINQAAPSLVQNNQCYDMVNFDITPNGALSPRRGFDYVSLAEDSTAGRSIQGLIPYNFIGNKHLLIQRTGGYPDRWEVFAAIAFGYDWTYVDTIWVDTAGSTSSHITTWLYDWPDSGFFNHQKMVDLINADSATSHCVAAIFGNYYIVTSYPGYTIDSLSTDTKQPVRDMGWFAENVINYTMVRSGSEDSIVDQPNTIQYSARPQTGVHSFQWSGKTWIASYGSEMQIFDGVRMYPARPLAPGQIKAVPIDNSGTGTSLTAKQVRYCYYYGHPAAEESNMSTPSFPVDVYNGCVYLERITVSGTNDTMTFLTRSIDGGPYKYLRKMYLGDNSTHIDSVPSGSAGAEPRYPYGYVPRCYSDFVGQSTNSQSGSGSTSPPGALVVARGNQASTGYGIAYPDSNLTLNPTPSQKSIAYSVVFVDTLGRRSYMAPPFCKSYITCDASTCTGTYDIMMDLTEIPVALDTFATVKRILLRSFGRACAGTYFSDTLDSGECPGLGGDDFDPGGCYDPGNWFIVDTLYDDDVTTYTDSMPACSIHIPSRLYCEGWEPYPQDMREFIYETSPTADNAAANCLDSVIGFKPTAILQRGAQAFAIGDPENPNRIYMSAFYDPAMGWTPSTWPLDKYFEIPGNGDDWFIALAVLNNDLFGFRQNSIVKISGFTYYQFQVQTISQRVGAIAPRSVVATKSHIYFADNDGVYITNGGTPRKISEPIDSIWVDLGNSTACTSGVSGAADCRRTVIGHVYEDEYWLQTNSSTWNTLIFSEKTGSWRRSSLDYTDIVNYTEDTLELDYRPAIPIIVRGDDSLYQLSPQNELDIWDTTGFYYYYRSREFFEGPAREKIHYIDIHGRGEVDSLVFVSYREGMQAVDTVTIGGVVGVTWGVRQDAPGSVRRRVRIDEIVPSYTFEMYVYPTRALSGNAAQQFAITSLVIGWQPWDEGRPR